MTPRRHRWVFVLATAAVSLGLFEGGARVAVSLLEGHSKLTFRPIGERLDAQTAAVRQILAGEDRLLGLDAEMGWIYRPGMTQKPYSSNAQGVRSLRTYAPFPKPGSVRVAAFGDSFIHANEVGDREAWSAQLEQIEPRVEILNYGVGGYGTDQALLLHARRGDELSPHVVVLGFAEVNYARNLNRYRPFLSPGDLPLGKPRFRRRQGDALELVPNPFPGRDGLARLLDDPRAVLEAGENDEFFAPLVWRNPLYDHSASVRLASTIADRVWRTILSGDRLYAAGSMNPDSDGFALLVALVKRFRSEVEAAGRDFLFVIFPGRREDIWGEGPRSYARLVSALEGTWVLDLADALADDPAISPEILYAPLGHLGPEANRTFARAVRNSLRSRGWLASSETRGSEKIAVANGPTTSP